MSKNDNLTVIDVRNIAKDFRVYHRSYGSLKGMTADWLRRALKHEPSVGFSIRHALSGVSFAITSGETVGLVGRNGAGKSTLLSILSRICLPTSGEADVYGDMISLLQLGAGFHPELTGVENVFFSAMLRGLTEQQVRDRFDKIIDFSELDTSTMDLPLRMYSSGMQLRLAFGIAAHLEADILLIDEGLAVGDAAFQQKCLNKMREYQSEGRTIVMVSHETDSISRFASRVIWMEHGKVRMDGPTQEILPKYIDASSDEEREGVKVG